MKKNLVILSMAAVLSLGLAACNSEDTSKDTTETAKKEETSKQSEEASAKLQTITY
ncbi:iron ABC transporter substrate-binding protein [Cytobacillus purgationiresistens]|uniref:Protein involved in sex pheromone biosynthesis n=1 Tax=Cytobacillus purgationiresistens TaxID=863449 RepID=A0ABU0ANS8_9BACI|nr:iron ABC transporter substrate-binding protein [Cytobacillus purgationiresistens]MDQ0272845.1 protein involved in sex pheromone biosynthesis [Cytobacillus purgationiresistens]